MSSGGISKKAADSGGPGGQPKSKKPTASGGAIARKPTSNATPSVNPMAQPEFLVEKITGKRYLNGRPQVQIKWKGYPPEENTWEPIENIGNCMVLLGDFEEELFRSRQRKKLQKRLKKNKTSSSGSKTSDGELPGTTQATTTGKRSDDVDARKERQVEIGKAMGPKANLTNSAIGSTPMPNTNYKKKFLLLSDSSDDEATLQPLQPKSSTPDASPSSNITIDTEIILSGSSELSDSQSLSELPMSKAVKGPTALNSQKQVRKDAASIKTKKFKCNEDSIEKTMMSIHSQPMVTSVSPQTSSPQCSKQLVEKSQTDQTPISSKKNLKVKDDSENPFMPLNTRHNKPYSNADESDWKMPLRKTPFGLARGLELDKIVHNFKVADKLFLFVNWKGLSATDVVALDELKLAYPAEVIQYFENMKRTSDDPST
ncbi:chromo domain-containing protein cec-1-like [Drosophila serrata]|uniref:chromo domain-containing protein cec-1-like n=1 Tax=Drosophila serrata TaxID=7274 RepID=UPI000A1D25F3|nr:chromo domain-containing protein cec-1-like [Drosophila serrata]